MQLGKKERLILDVLAQGNLMRGMTGGEIGRALGKDHSYVVAPLAHLERIGYVESGWEGELSSHVYDLPPRTPPRWFYRLTSNGREARAELMAEGEVRPSSE